MLQDELPLLFAPVDDGRPAGEDVTSEAASAVVHKGGPAARLLGVVRRAATGIWGRTER